MIKVTSLGQVGFEFVIDDKVIVIDPYLSNSVAENENSQYQRLVPIKINPHYYSNIDFVLITHKHGDHCDQQTLVPISRSSNCQFIAPNSAADCLIQWGIDSNRVISCKKGDIALTPEITIKPIPSAHPTIVETGAGYEAVGYIIRTKNKVIYHAGDTALTNEVINAVKANGKIDVAFIPVNEQNYIRDQLGIIGNMSVREAFYFAEAINADLLVPTHWDMFAINQVYREEIELLYEKQSGSFRLEIYPTTI